MAKSTSLRTCKSIGSRTRSKRPDAPIVSLPANGRMKKRVQSKLKLKKNDNAATSTSAAANANSEMNAKSKSKVNDEESKVATAEKATKRRRVSESPEKKVGTANGSNRIGDDTSRKNNAGKPDTITTAAAATIQPEPATTSKAPTTVVKRMKPIVTNIKQTPHQRPQCIQTRNISPSPLPTTTPSFPTKWQSLSHPTATLPPGVIDISSYSHSCCFHSHHSHGGYSWLASKRRCGCLLDGDHNTSESLSEVYIGHYGWGEREEFKTEKWLFDSFRGTGGCWLDQDKELRSHLDYLPRQPHLTSNMRSILMDWMVEMSMEYGLHAETVHLSVVLVDRALACVGLGNKGEMVVEKDRLQCVGCACTLIASKLLEITPPTVQDFCYISDNSYTSKEILDCEAEISSALKFNFNYQTPYRYVDQFLRASVVTPNGKMMNQKKMTERLILYFLDLSLLDYKFVGMKPSLVTAAAVYLARATLGIRETETPTLSPFTGAHAAFYGQYTQHNSTGYWTKTLEYYTGYDKWDIEEAVKMLRRLHENAESNHLKSVYAKFKSESFGKVALKTVLNEDDLGFF